MNGRPALPKSVVMARTLVIAQLLPLCGCGILPIGLLVPAFLMMGSGLAAYAVGVNDHWVLLPGMVAPVFACAWIVLTERLLHKRDLRGRHAVDIGTATLIVLALMAFVATGLAFGWVRYSWISSLSALPSIGLQLAASLCLRTESAEAWFSGAATETPLAETADPE